jgi:hypothetical protein
MAKADYDVIYKHLRDNDADFDSIYFENNGVVSVSVEWGDWKHSHGFLDFLMSQLGFTLFKERVTEEDGSDTYSSIHYYS